MLSFIRRCFSWVTAAVSGQPSAPSHPQSKRASAIPEKPLPENFEELLKAGDLEPLKAVFESCDVNARGGYGKQTALAFDQCPDALARWLVAQGADLSATNTWGDTPLHQRARSHRGRIEVLLELGADVHANAGTSGTPLHSAVASYNVRHARLLLQHGANVDAVDRDGLTPLEYALRVCQNTNIENMVPLAYALFEAGARTTPRMKGFVTALGQKFEFHRSGYNPENVDAVSDALEQLYVMFDTPPVPRRTMHDGKTPIVVQTQTWQKQHEELWNLLIPSGGPATTVQGEVIRITGRISDELHRNGGANWDDDYNAMADALLTHFQSGVSLSKSDLEEAETHIAELKEHQDDSDRLPELAVQWVLQNPQPTKLPPPAYDR